ncbi:unnamed protein product [Peniophora sp. CBMAI 1063]|nr:unnamed protein product [Peniophora sp. CBMAI 1063]
MRFILPHMFPAMLHYMNMSNRNPVMNLYCYLEYLLMAQIKAGEGVVNLDEGPQPVAFMDFYDYVRDNPGRIRGERIHIIFVGREIGITSEQSRRDAAVAGYPDAYSVRTTSMLRAYSIWRYWLRLLAKLVYQHPELDQAGIVELGRQRLPTADALEASVETEFHPDAPAMFAPPPKEIHIDIQDDSSDEALSDSSDVSEDPGSFNDSDAGEVGGYASVNCP